MYPVLLDAAPWSFSDQGFLVFCSILLAVFGAMFALISRHAERTTQVHTELLIFKTTTEANFQLLQTRIGETARVGIFHALEILNEPNPWTADEMAIRDKMHRAPELTTVTASEILTVIRRLDAEIADGILTGDKRMAALYMLRELNGELKRREVGSTLMEQRR